MKPTITEPYGGLRWPWAVIAYVGIVIVAAAGFFVLRQDQEEIRKLQEFDARRAVELCEASNESRLAIIHAFGTYTDALVAASNTSDEPRTPEENRRRMERAEQFREDVRKRLEPLSPRDCDATEEEVVEDAR